MKRLTKLLGTMARFLGPSLFALGVLVIVYIPIYWLVTPHLTAAQVFLSAWKVTLLGIGMQTVGVWLIKNASVI